MNDLERIVESAFASGGPIARAAGAGYEVRPGQVALSRAVARALSERKVLLGEAGTGSGKSYGYLVPLTHACSGGRMRAVVSTAGIALQTQLAEKDLPFLQRALPWRFTFALLKGRHNMACDEAIHAGWEKAESLVRLGGERAAQILQIRRWYLDTSRGDRGELPFVPSGEVWRLFGCRGRCDPEEGDRCFSHDAKARAAAADVVVINHHLLVCHLLVSTKTRGRAGVVPKRDKEDAVAFDALVVDEAHELASVSRDFLGWRLTEAGLRRTARSARKILVRDDLRDRELRELDGEIETLFNRVVGRAESKSLSNQEVRLTKRFRELYSQLAEDVETAIAADEETNGPPPERDNDDGDDPPDDDDDEGDVDAGEAADAPALLRRLHVAAERLVELTEARDAGSAYYADAAGKGRSAAVGARRIDVATVLGPFLTGVGTTVLTSATLAVPGDPAGPFAFVRGELGIPDTSLEIEVPSPFDMTRQSIFVVPGDEVLPDDPRLWERSKDEADKLQLFEAEAEVVRDVALQCGGRTMALFTSHAHVAEIAKRLKRHKLPYKISCQGDAPIGELVADLKADRGTILLGTNSLWQGVDVVGDALSAVVIARLPHPNATDPVVSALIEREENEGASSYEAWQKHALPRSIVAFRQGVGRLIRSASDVGAVVILDRRIWTKNYGTRFFEALPEIERPGEDVGAIGAFLRERRASMRGAKVG